MAPDAKTPTDTVTIAAAAWIVPAGVSTSTPRPPQRMEVAGVDSRASASAPLRSVIAP